jgi:hypothetical protein
MGFLVGFFLGVPAVILALGIPMVVLFTVVGYFTETKEDKDS